MSTHSLSPLLKMVGRGELFHVTDVETTGLTAGIDRVIELATVTVRDGEIVDRFETLINPGVDLTSATYHITGIHGGMIEKAPTPEVALKRWLNYLGGEGQFVAHNANFDWGFLKAEFARAGLEFPFKRKYCTMKLAGHFLPYGGRLKLEHLLKRFNVDASATHRAMADADAAAKLFIKLVEHLQNGTSPEPPRSVREAPPVDLSGDPWEALLRYLKPRSLVTAAVLGQHAAAQPLAEDGTLSLVVAEAQFPYLDGQRGVLEEAVRAVYGPDTKLVLEVRSPVQ